MLIKVLKDNNQYKKGGGLEEWLKWYCSREEGKTWKETET
jgi:hypothetical protein